MKSTLQRALDNATSVEDVDRIKRQITHKINTDCVDRYKTVIVPRGMRDVNYRGNACVYLNHKTDDLPIAKNLTLKVYDRKIIARTQFPPQGINPTADKVFDLYELEYLNGWSVSIDPIAYGAPTADEIRKRPEWAESRCMYREWDLLEYSCVGLPGNAEVVRKAVSRGLALPGWEVEPEPAPVSRETAPALPPLVGRTIEDVQASVLRGLFSDSEEQRKRVMRDAMDLAHGRV